MRFKLIFLLGIICIALLAAGVLGVFPNSSSGTSYQTNLTIVVSGSANASGDSYNAQINLAEYVVGNSSGSSYNMFWGFPYTTEGGMGPSPEPSSANITISTFNGSEYVTGESLSFSTCTIGSVFCQPDRQVFNTSNKSIGILNITSSGSLDVSNISFRINDTCPHINLTFSNHTNLTKNPRQSLDTSAKALYGNLSTGLSFEFYLWANISTPSSACPEIKTEFEVT